MKRNSFTEVNQLSSVLDHHVSDETPGPAVLADPLEVSEDRDDGFLGVLRLVHREVLQLLRGEEVFPSQLRLVLRLQNVPLLLLLKAQFIERLAEELVFPPEAQVELLHRLAEAVVGEPSLHVLWNFLKILHGQVRDGDHNHWRLGSLGVLRDLLTARVFLLRFLLLVWQTAGGGLPQGLARDVLEEILVPAAALFQLLSTSGTFNIRLVSE